MRAWVNGIRHIGNTAEEPHVEDVPVASLHAAAVGIVFNRWLRLAFRTVCFIFLFYFTTKLFFFNFRTTFFLGSELFSIPIFYLQVKGSIRCLFHSCMNLNLRSLSSTAQDFCIRGTKKKNLSLFGLVAQDLIILAGLE